MMKQNYNKKFKAILSNIKYIEVDELNFVLIW